MKNESLLEKIMRFSPIILSLSLTLAMFSSAGNSKNPDYQIDPLSIEMQEKGDAAMLAGQAEEAIDYYQSALAADPRNRQAYISMARVERTKGLKGKAIRYYGEALEIDPNDMAALAEQGEVMASKGAVEQARKNLARLKMLCRLDCGSVNNLAQAVEKADRQESRQASAEIPPAAPMEDKAN